MKKLMTGCAAAAVLFTASASAEVTGNIGFLSDYVFRGIPQADSVANGGVDWGQDGFYLGTWAADVEEGLEIDFYGGYNFDIEDFNFGVGGTYYYYTDNFDGDYKEINLAAGWKFISLEGAIGKWDNPDGGDDDYQFFSAKVEHKGLYAKFGSFFDDFDGSYFEAGYGMDVAGFDLGISYVYSNDTLVGTEDNSTLILSLSKSFGIME